MDRKHIDTQRVCFRSPSGADETDEMAVHEREKGTLMAGFSKIYCLGELGGFQGADGINSIGCQFWVGNSDRKWWEAHYFDDTLSPLATSVSSFQVDRKARRRSWTHAWPSSRDSSLTALRSPPSVSRRWDFSDSTFTSTQMKCQPAGVIFNERLEASLRTSSCSRQTSSFLISGTKRFSSAEAKREIAFSTNPTPLGSGSAMGHEDCSESSARL